MSILKCQLILYRLRIILRTRLVCNQIRRLIFPLVGLVKVWALYGSIQLLHRHLLKLFLILNRIKFKILLLILEFLIEGIDRVTLLVDFDTSNSLI